ncbi:bifunctional diguanylate cyclase/phosphodiesterase [Paraburkholderia sp. BCC1886]|uniref:bifunctional diguanylate cyclase/phosphodiesterase n=1 Tax=Paraburkholderia sp. BCC1886 TaxID=2562670 RepID=UPI001182F973|nr:bifunctional diguanylate cyclase/phosphodiesterase [Paraburkholderia sp. BCC1886]
MANNLLSRFAPQTSDPGLRERFHRRSLEHQRPLSTVTMAFSVVAFVFFVIARNLVAGPTAPLAARLGCALALALLALTIPYTRSTRSFGAVGVAYTLVMIAGLTLNVAGVEAPLLWTLPALVVFPICAAPLWLTPTHFGVGSVLFYASAYAVLAREPLAHDAKVVAWMWVVAIGLPLSAVFHIGFYRFRRHHFLLESQLAQLAATDPLTGLQNRREFVKQAGRRLDAMAPEARVSAIFLDIDNFKSLNDRFGHAVGDRALFQVAQVLMAQVRPGDSVSRIGGEEFAVLLDDGLDGALRVAERLRSALTTIARPDGHLSASFGVAQHRRGENIMVLLDRADEALLRAKYSGRNRVCAERPPTADAQSDELADEQAVAANAGRAIAMGTVQRWDRYELTSHFQPLYSLSHQKQVGFEALLRGRLDDGTLVPPAVLFAPKPASDEIALDRLSHAVHLAHARTALPDDAWLFLNILPATFVTAGYADRLAALVNSAGLAPARVILEILESHGSSVDEMSRVAALYREHGFLIAVDDFGAGQSNLDRLFRIRPDLVKLDGELIRATGHGTAQPILPQLVSLLHRAGMLVVVEGVETAEELVLAVRSNVDFAQGYLLGRPAGEIVAPEPMHRQIDAAFDAIAHGRAHQHTLFETEVEPYRAALQKAVAAMHDGHAEADAFAELARSPRCISCFHLDDSGRQIGQEIPGPAWRREPGSLHVASQPRGGRWDHRPYFRNAVLRPGVAVASHPYLSLTAGRTCVAVTMAVRFAGERRVLGAVLDWSTLGLPWPAGE